MVCETCGDSFTLSIVESILTPPIKECRICATATSLRESYETIKQLRCEVEVWKQNFDDAVKSKNEIIAILESELEAERGKVKQLDEEVKMLLRLLPGAVR